MCEITNPIYGIKRNDEMNNKNRFDNEIDLKDDEEALRNPATQLTGSIFRKIMHSSQVVLCASRNPTYDLTRL
jgi:hypothetical protein